MISTFLDSSLDIKPCTSSVTINKAWAHLLRSVEPVISCIRCARDSTWFTNVWFWEGFHSGVEPFLLMNSNEEIMLFHGAPPTWKLFSVLLETLCVTMRAEKLKSEVGYSFVFLTLIDIVEIWSSGDFQYWPIKPSHLGRMKRLVIRRSYICADEALKCPAELPSLSFLSVHQGSCWSCSFSWSVAIVDAVLLFFLQASCLCLCYDHTCTSQNQKQQKTGSGSCIY